MPAIGYGPELRANFEAERILLTEGLDFTLNHAMIPTLLREVPSEFYVGIVWTIGEDGNVNDTIFDEPSEIPGFLDGAAIDIKQWVLVRFNRRRA